MDGNRFDRLARTLSVPASRRQGLAAVLALALSSARSARGAAAQDEPASAPCEPGFVQCEVLGECVDLQSDLDNCGACGAVCESGLVSVECRGGECVRASCPVGVDYCGAVDGCRNLASDPAHCGACGNACPGGVCLGGVCVSSGGVCAEGEAECDGECVATCCNNEHCGACGNACTPPFTCFEGICACPSGNCPPIKLPDTGVGAAGEPEAAAPWAVLAAILAASKAIADRRLTARAPTEGGPAADA